MKKNIFTCICSLLISYAGIAQVSKDSLMKLMSAETCIEISKKDLSNKNMDELELELGLAMMPVVVKYMDQLKTLGYNIEDQQGMEGMGRDIGMLLAKDCPSFLKMFMKNPGALKEAIEKEKPDVLPSNVFGTLIKIVPGDFSYIQVKDGSGKIEKLWWMEYFEGSDKLINQSQKFLNKTVKVSYTEKEVYNATLKEYVKVKIISGID